MAADQQAEDDRLAEALQKDALVALDAAGESKPREEARAKEAAELMRQLQEGTATDEDRRAALEHLHPQSRRLFEDRWH